MKILSTREVGKMEQYFKLKPHLFCLLWIYTKPKQNGSTFLSFFLYLFSLQSLIHNSSLYMFPLCIIQCSLYYYYYLYIFTPFLSHCFKSFSKSHLGINTHCSKFHTKRKSTFLPYQPFQTKPHFNFIIIIIILQHWM